MAIQNVYQKCGYSVIPFFGSRKCRVDIVKLRIDSMRYVKAKSN